MHTDSPNSQEVDKSNRTSDLKPKVINSVFDDVQIYCAGLNKKLILETCRENAEVQTRVIQKFAIEAKQKEDNLIKRRLMHKLNTIYSSRNFTSTLKQHSPVQQVIKMGPSLFHYSECNSPLFVNERDDILLRMLENKHTLGSKLNPIKLEDEHTPTRLRLNVNELAPLQPFGLKLRRMSMQSLSQRTDKDQIDS